MALGVVIFNVQEIGGFFEACDVPVEVSQPFVNVRVAGADVSNVALEVLDIYGLRNC